MSDAQPEDRLDTLIALSRAIEARLAALQHGEARLEARLTHVEGLVQRLGGFSHGSNATYMGNGLVLVRAMVHGHQIAYLVEADDRLISPWFIVGGHYETELTDFFVPRLREDDHCLDIGGNFGYFTCLFARLCPQGRVIGVEPDPKVFAILRDNVHINGLGGHGASLHAAVSDAEGEVLLHRRVGRSGNTSITEPAADFVAFLGEPPSERFTVATTTVDRLAERFSGRLDIMKVDVEGAEPLVLRGAAATIAANPHLQIVMEWSPGQIASAGFDNGVFLDEISAMGLSCHGLQRGTPLIDRDALLNLPYAAGILLTRAPR